MHKRFVTTLLALIACVACLIGLVACGDDAEPVAGKTYEFEKATVESGTEGAAKEMMEATMNRLYEGSSLSFGESGSFAMSVMGRTVNGTYTQNGAAVAITYENETRQLTVSENQLVISEETEGLKVNVVYTLVSDRNEDDGEGEEGGNENEGTETGNVTDVAGKTFVFSDLTVSFEDSVSQEIKDMVNGSLDYAKRMYEGSTLMFDNHGGFTMNVSGSSATGIYTQDGTTLALTAQSVDGEEDVPDEDATQIFTLSGNKLSASYSSDGITQIMIYNLQENE